MELPKLTNSEIESIQTPSYLEVLHESNAILVRKKKNENSGVFDNSYNKLTIHNGREDLNLTGTPLDCPFQTKEELDTSLGYDISTVKWRKTEENHFPFEINDAIQFLTAYNLEYKGDGDSQNKTVWVALDSKDSRRTVLMGLLIEGYWRIRKTVCQSKIPLNGVQAYGERIRKTHMMMSGANENNSKCKVSVAYDVVRKAEESDTANDMTSIKLHSTWNSSLLRKDLTSPPPEASTTLSVEIKSGSKQSKIHHLWNQLVFLNELVGVTLRKEVSLPESVLMRVDTMKRVMELVKAEDGYEMKCGGLAAKDVHAENISEVVQGERDTCDFPSKLWELLICCQSCSELVECFEYVCDEAERGEITPYIHPQNKTCFSTLILDLCTGVAMPKYFCLTEARALDMLKEMGLYSLQRSYLHILLTSNWCSSYQLDTNIPKDNQMARLGKLHIVLDLFLTMQQHMNLPLQCIQSLFSVAIVKFLEKVRSFEDVLEHRLMKFCHVLRTTDVVCHLTKHFTSWELQIETDLQNENLYLSTICNVSNESIFPPPLALPVLEESNADDNGFGDIPLFGAHLTVIGNKIMNNYNNANLAACRLCMLSLPESSMEPNIFKPSEAGSISNKIASVTHLLLYEGDGLPTTVCHQCLFQLALADQFIQKCTLSNKFFQSQVTQRELNTSTDDKIEETSFLDSWEKAMQTPPSEEFLLALEFVKSTHGPDLNETDYICSPVCEVPENVTNCNADEEQCDLFDFENGAEFNEVLNEVDNISLTMEEFGELSICLAAEDFGVDYCDAPTVSGNARQVNLDSVPLPGEKLLKSTLEEIINSTGSSEHSSSRVDNISITNEQFLGTGFCNTLTCPDDILKVHLNSTPVPAETLLEPSLEENMNINMTGSSEHSSFRVDNISKEQFLDAGFCDTSTCANNTRKEHLESAALPMENLLEPSLEENKNVSTTCSSKNSSSTTIDKIIKKEAARNQNDPLLSKNVEVILIPLPRTDHFYRQAAEKMKAQQASKQLPSLVQLQNLPDLSLHKRTPQVAFDKKANQPKLAMTRSKCMMAAQKSASQIFNCEKCSSTFKSKVVLVMHKESQACEKLCLKLKKAGISHHKRELLKKSNIQNSTPMHQLVIGSKLDEPSSQFVIKRMSKLNCITLLFKCSLCSCAYKYKHNLHRHAKKNHSTYYSTKKKKKRQLTYYCSKNTEDK